MEEQARQTFNPDWEREAQNWIAWARTPGHDSYWKYSPAFFEIVPAPWRATLEIGCGEGRVARDLAKRGHRVAGIDASPTLIDAARRMRRSSSPARISRAGGSWSRSSATGCGSLSMAGAIHSKPTLAPSRKRDC